VTFHDVNGVTKFLEPTAASLCHADALVLWLEMAFQFIYIYIRNPQFLVSQEIGNNGRYLVDVGVGGVRALI